MKASEESDAGALHLRMINKKHKGKNIMTLAEIDGIGFPITKEDIEELHRLACEVGSTFRMIRSGEEDKNSIKTRKELEKPYIPLAKLINKLYEKVKNLQEDV